VIGQEAEPTFNMSLR